ncbi:hypothetical protein F1880_000090 [Penicillium rolfsii]|nr:hypothetical protein F1880_000090 [Penicillium rolfsii]
MVKCSKLTNTGRQFLNPDFTAKTQVPGIRALRWIRKAYRQVEDRPSDAVEKAVDDFFAAGSKENPIAVTNGFKRVVKTALDYFLGETAAGEHTEERFFFYMLHNTLVRIDVRLWLWNSSGKGLFSNYKSVLGCIVCISIVDPTKLSPEEFDYLISEHEGDQDADVKKYIKAMGERYQEAQETFAKRVKESSLHHGR